MGQGQVQHAGVAGQGGVEGTLKAAHHDTGALHVRLIFQKAAGQHGHQGQRHKRRHHNRQAHHHRKLVEQQADHAGHEKDGNEHRDQRHRDRNNGEAHFARTAQGRLKRVLTLFHVADDVLQHHNGIVHHQADSEGQAQKRDVVEAVVQAPKQCHRTNQRHGQRQGRNDGSHKTAQKQKDHQHHQNDGADQGERDVVQSFPHRQRAVVHRRHLHRGRHLGLQGRQCRADGVHHLHRISARLALHRQGNRGLAIQGGPAAECFQAVFHLGHIAQTHRVAALGAHNQIGKFGRIAQLLVGLEHQRLLGAFEGTHRCIHVGSSQGRADFIQPDVAGGQRLRLHPHPHRIALGAEHVDLRHTAHGREGRHDQVLGVVLQLGRRQRGGLQSNEQDRGVRRVHLAVRRRVGHVRGQGTLRAQQSGLHVDSRRIDIAGLFKLQRERGTAQRAGGADGFEARYRLELLFKRQRHRCGHGLRARTG